MYILTDYLYFRGDLSFRESPVNEIDEMVFASLGKADYSGILAENEIRSYPEVFGEYFERHNENDAERLGLLASPVLVKTLHSIARCPRYEHIGVSHFVKKISEKETEQMSALTVHGPDGIIYVTFRGTDDTLVGWKENCELAVLDSVPAQRDAADYLDKVAGLFSDPIVVLGHSKGGNLAVYASACARDDVKKRILKVVSYDGPGFMKKFLDSTEYASVKDRITTVVPETSIVGMLMKHAGRMSVVECEKNGPSAHDFFNWDLTRDGFVKAVDISEKSRILQRAVNMTLNEMDGEERQELVDELFEALSSTGATTLMEFTENTFMQAVAVAERFRKSRELKQFIRLLSFLCLKGTMNSTLGELQELEDKMLDYVKEKLEGLKESGQH